MKLMKIGIDIDGVLARFDQEFAKVLLRFSKRVQELPIDAPDFPATWHWPSHYGVEAEAEHQAWEWVMNPDNHFWDDLPPMPEAEDALMRLYELRLDGHDIYFITSRPGPRCKLIAERWLEAHGMFCPTVLISNKKGLVAAGLQLDAFIDDRDKNIMEVALARGKACQTFLLKRPYNCHCKDEWRGLKFLQDVELVGSVGEMLDRLGLEVEDGVGVEEQRQAA